MSDAAGATQSVIVHAHCYQPPREDPWREAIDVEPSAAPDHDWNARIDRESYSRLACAEVRVRAAGGAAHDTDAKRALVRFVNLYAWCSFDVGATLCEWLAAEAPTTLAAMQAGDAASVRRLGHGNAIAAPYHHVILPLASRRDRITEIRWGIADFRRRFSREPEGMWLPECAVDEDTLDILAQEGIRFTILAPYQLRGANGLGMPVRWRGTHGREIAILPYDGNLAGEVAFGGLLRDPGALARRLASPKDATSLPYCTTLATDGETFGHHHRGGDGALAETLTRIARETSARITNVAALIAAHPPTQEVSLVSPSAWSCAHGVERWRSNCGCRLDGTRPPAQEWRGPLRIALSALAERCGEVFEHEGRALFASDPWHVRDLYGDVVALDGAALDAFVRRQVIADATPSQVARARVLLELERASLRTFTSCAWFFDDVDRIETRQVLRYAARSMDLSGIAARLEPTFVESLSQAVGGGANRRSGSDVFVREALPHRDVTWSVAAGAIACAAQGIPLARLATFDVSTHIDGTVWRVDLEHRRTGQRSSFAGTSRGTGETLVVTLRGTASDAESTRNVPVQELPESVAALLLQHTSLDDLRAT